MTPSKILEVLDIYEKQLNAYTFGNLMPNQFTKIQHMSAMIPQMRKFLKDQRLEKTHRWLGFMQGAFWVMGIYSIHEMRDHNKL